MKFCFTLEKNNFLPVYYLNLECNEEYRVHTCIDTGAGISTLFIKKELIEKLYKPYIKKTSYKVTVNMANGSRIHSDVYCISDFILTDDDGAQSHIRDFCFIIQDAKLKGIDVLLSGNVFFNTKLSISPRRINNELMRVCAIETRNGIDSLHMQPYLDGNGKINGFPALAQTIGK